MFAQTFMLSVLASFYFLTHKQQKLILAKLTKGILGKVFRGLQIRRRLEDQA